jgi:hypothetical protein
MNVFHKTVYSIAVLLLISIAAYGFDVSGTVFKPDSITPVSGAQVFAYEKGADDATIPPVCVAQAIADQNGNYAMTLDGAAQKYYLMGKSSDVSDSLGKRIKKWITGPTTTAHIYMEKAHEGFTNITGTITNTNGDPVPDAKVVLRSKVSTGGTARFNVDSAVTGADGTYSIPNAQVMIPETVGEKVASFHIYKDGYDDGVVDPLEMSGPEMVIDFVLTGGPIGILFSGSNGKEKSIFTVAGKMLQVSNLGSPALLKVYKTNGAILFEKNISKGVSSVSLAPITGGQILIIRLIPENSPAIQKAMMLF